LSEENIGFSKDETLIKIKKFLNILADKYTGITSVYISHNTNKADILI
jgi:hypothetical protein